MGVAVDRIVEPNRLIKMIEFQLPERIFGTTDKNGNPLKSVSACCYDIKKRLADVLREIKPAEFLS